MANLNKTPRHAKISPDRHTSIHASETGPRARAYIRPRPAPNWTLSSLISRDKLTKPHTQHGNFITRHHNKATDRSIAVRIRVSKVTPFIQLLRSTVALDFCICELLYTCVNGYHKNMIWDILYYPINTWRDNKKSLKFLVNMIYDKNLMSRITSIYQSNAIIKIHDSLFLFHDKFYFYLLVPNSEI